jgi:WD40 repeat protein
LKAKSIAEVLGALHNFEKNMPTTAKRSSWRTKVLFVTTTILSAATTTPTRAQDKLSIETVPVIPHSWSINSVALSPDAARVISAGREGQLKLWDAATGRLLRTLIGHTHEVMSVAFSPDGATALSGGLDQTVKLWDAASGRVLLTLQGHSNFVHAVAFSPDGKTLLSASEDGTVKLWERETGKLVRTLGGSWLGFSSPAFAVAVSPDGARIASGHGDKTVKVWEATTGRLLLTLKGHSSEVFAVAFSPDGTLILSGGWLGAARNATDSLRLWDAATGRPIRIFSGSNWDNKSIAFAPGGARIFSGALSWNVQTGEMLSTPDGAAGTYYPKAYSQDGSFALSVVERGGSDELSLWRTQPRQRVRIFAEQSQGFRSVSLSTDGSRLLTVNASDVHYLTGYRPNDAPAGRLNLWSTATGQIVRSFKEAPAYVGSAALSPDGQRVLAGSSGDPLKLLDAVTGTFIRTFEESDGDNYSVAFSPDGTRVISEGKHGTLQLWETATGRRTQVFEGHSGLGGHVNSVLFSHNGTRIASGGTGSGVRLWNARSGQLMRVFDTRSNGEVASVAFSPDDSRVLSAGSLDIYTPSSSQALQLWNSETGAHERSFDDSGKAAAMVSAAFSPAGTLIVSGANDHKIRIWDVGSGHLLRTLLGHSGSVVSVAFSPDGTRIFSASDDTTLREWRTDTGELLLTSVAARNGEWLSMTPEGFFNASSPKASGLLSVVRGLSAYGVDQMWQSLFNPDLVREKLSGDPDKEVEQATTVMNLEKVLDSGMAPRIAITSPVSEIKSSEEIITPEATIIDNEGGGIGRVEWRVNGVTVGVTNPAPGSSPTIKVKQTLALDPGENIIEVIGYNGRNLLASVPAQVKVTWTGAVAAVKPKLHVLAIGINDYNDPGLLDPKVGEILAFPKLGLAVADAKVFGAAITAATKDLYDSVEVTFALDADATSSRLDQIVNGIAVKLHPRDVFILYAAAHGYSIGGRFYLIPQDYKAEGTDFAQSLTKHAIGQERLQDWLVNRIKAKKALVLLDTCASGALVAGYSISHVDLPASESAIGRLHEATGRPVLTAAAAGKEALEGVGEPGNRHGVFTYALMDALAKGDTNGDGLISLSELALHVQNLVPQLSPVIKLMGREPVTQKPKLGSRGEDFIVSNRLR